MRKGNARFGKRDMGYVQTLNSLVLGLFSNGEPGFWLDPSDFSTMFQDSAGTTPVTAVEQPVGLILDKSKTVVSYSNYFNGSAYLSVASNAAFGYGTGDFTIELWAFFTVISASTPNLIDQRAGANTQPAPTIYLNNGTLSYFTNGNNRIVGSTLSANTWYHIALARQSGSTKLFVNGTQVGSTYADGYTYITSPVRVFASNDGATTVYQTGCASNLRIVKGTALYTANFTPPTGPLTAVAGTSLLTCQSTAFVDNSSNAFAITNTSAAIGYAQPFNISYFQSTAGVRPVLSARVNLLLATATLSTRSVTVTAGSYVLAFSGAGSIALSGVSSGTKTAGSNTITCTAGTLTLTVTGSVTLADLRPADQATGLIPLYQAVVTATNYDTAGFPLYLSFNGTQWMQTASCDYTGVGTILVAAGVRKLSDAARGMVIELSAVYTNPGTFAIDAPASVAPNFGAHLNAGSGIFDATYSTYSAPLTVVNSASFITTASSISTRINGSVATPSTSGSTIGTAFGNYPHYIGARAGTSLFLTGNIYQLIARGSVIASNAAQISAAESWTDLKTRAY